MWSTEDKERVFRLTQERFWEVYAPILPEHKGCLAWAGAAKWVLEKHFGFNDSMISGGSVSFQMRLPENDDGVSATHFSYQFEPMPAVIRHTQGLLPEMHSWLCLNIRDGDHRKVELVDFTTGFQEQQCFEMIGAKWDEELRLPSYLWCLATEIPKNCIYQVHPLAQRLCSQYLEELHLHHKIAA